MLSNFMSSFKLTSYDKTAMKNNVRWVCAMMVTLTMRLQWRDGKLKEVAIASQPHTV